LSDPVVGDRLVVIPALAGHGLAVQRRFLAFDALPSGAGLVIAPLADDLSVTVQGDRVALSQPGGLALSTAVPLAANNSPAALARAADSKAYLDFAAWRAGGGKTFYATQHRLQAIIARRSPAQAGPARLTLAKFYLANDFAAETLGLLDILQQSDPLLKDDAQLQAMRAAANVMMGRDRDALNALASPLFENDPHAALWRGLAEAGLGHWSNAQAALLRAQPVLARYPARWQGRARIAMAQAALALGQPALAATALDAMPPALPAHMNREAQLLRARLDAAHGRAAHTRFAALEKSGDAAIEARAIYADTVARLSAGSLSRAQAIEALEKLRYRWRGDRLELRTLRKLGALYFAGHQWRQGLQVLRVAAQNFPQGDQGREAQDTMRKVFADLFLNGKAKAMAPVEALSLFYDFIDLTPIGPDGDKMIRLMADRLVAVDLLGPAAKLLDYQVKNRLDGVARAQVAARLAAIDLMDRRPKDALAALLTTRIAGTPDALTEKRNLLEARALAALKQWDRAEDLIGTDNSAAADHLRADIAWESGRWEQAAQRSEALLGTRWKDATPLSATDRAQIMRAAIAYSLADDEKGLDALRTHYAAPMKATPDASAFAVITQNIDLHGVAFRDVARRIASVDTLETFMQDFGKAAQ
jgi:hypothetical protein